MNQIREGFGNKARNTSKHNGYCKYTALFNVTYLYLTPWSRVLLEKPSGSKLVINSPRLMEPEGSLLHLQVSAACPYPEPLTLKLKTKWLKFRVCRSVHLHTFK